MPCLQDGQKCERPMLNCFPAQSSPSQLMVVTSSFQCLRPKPLKSFLAPIFLTSGVVKKSCQLSLKNISRMFSFLTVPTALVKTTVIFQQNYCSSLLTDSPTSNVACLHSVLHTVDRVVILKYESSYVTPAQNHLLAFHFT